MALLVDDPAMLQSYYVLYYVKTWHTLPFYIMTLNSVCNKLVMELRNFIYHHFQTYWIMFYSDLSFVWKIM